MSFVNRLMIVTAVWAMAACADSDFAARSGMDDNKPGEDKPTKNDDDESPDDGPLQTDGGGETKPSGTDGENDGTDDGSLDSDAESTLIEDFDDISTSTGTVRCELVDDPNATLDVGSQADLRNGGRLAINDFVNQTCQAFGNAWVTSAAGVVGTAETALTICRLKGFKSVRTSVTQAFTSPGNNQIANWDGVAKKFTIIPATQNNIWFGYIQCAEKLKAKCMKDIKVTCG